MSSSDLFGSSDEEAGSSRSMRPSGAGDGDGPSGDDSEGDDTTGDEAPPVLANKEMIRKCRLSIVTNYPPIHFHKIQNMAI